MSRIVARAKIRTPSGFLNHPRGVTRRAQAKKDAQAGRLGVYDFRHTAQQAFPLCAYPRSLASQSSVEETASERLSIALSDSRIRRVKLRLTCIQLVAFLRLYLGSSPRWRFLLQLLWLLQYNIVTEAENAREVRGSR